MSRRKAVRTLVYFKLDESLAHSNCESTDLNFAGHRVNAYLICAGYNIIYTNYRVLLGWQEVQMS